MKTQLQILTDNPNLIPYRVTLKECEWDKFTYVFDCYAEDDDHAAEQAENSYPGHIVYNVTFFPEGLQS